MKKTKSNYSAVPPVIKMEHYIIIANITSWNLTISKLTLSTNQLPKQGSYWQTLLNKLILLLEGKKVLFSSFVEKISEEV